MTLIDVVDKNNVVYLIPIGDLHLGAKTVDYEKLEGYIKWIKENPAYCFLMGDLFDVATLESPTSPFEQEMSLNEAIDYLKDLLMPIRDRVIGCIMGNHEYRLMKHAGFDILLSFCSMLQIKYCGNSAVIRFRIGKHTRTKLGYTSPKIEYIFYAHHSTGGGRTLGGKLNRAEELRWIFEGADGYLIGHNHFKVFGENIVYYLSKSGNGKASIKSKKICYIDCGSYVIYDNSYAERMMLRPSHTGSPRIRMDGVKKDLHISY